ncbi:MAG TPA: hypothetical protein DCQ57_10360, partial [Enterobacteriaceae bacterium]|nr:hypothetical protein [Enterobacteriaceae bacterium]
DGGDGERGFCTDVLGEKSEQRSSNQAGFQQHILVGIYYFAPVLRELRCKRMFKLQRNMTSSTFFSACLIGRPEKPP